MACELGALAETRGCIPVHNTSTLQVIGELGARFAWLSPELSLTEACELASTRVLPVGVCVYGRPRLMTCEHCALQVVYECDRDHARCPHRRGRHWLVNIDDRHLPVRTDERGRSRVYLDEPVDLVGLAHELAEAGVSRFLVDATTTSVPEACDALCRLHRALAGEPVSSPNSASLSETGVQ